MPRKSDFDAKRPRLPKELNKLIRLPGPPPRPNHTKDGPVLASDILLANQEPLTTEEREASLNAMDVCLLFYPALGLPKRLIFVWVIF